MAKTFLGVKLEGEHYDLVESLTKSCNCSKTSIIVNLLDYLQQKPERYFEILKELYEINKKK